MSHISLRVGVDLRFVEGTLGRGMGRYTLQQLHAVITNTPNYHFVLFCLKNIPPSLRAFAEYKNVTLENSFVRYDLDLFVKHPHYARAVTNRLDRLAWQYRLDVLHIPILLNFIQPIVTDITACPVVMTVYDLILHIFAPHFPQTPAIQHHYHLGLARYTTSDHLIVISQATKQDVVRLLGYSEEKISVVYPAVDAGFIPQATSITTPLLTKLWVRLGISAPAQYIFTVTDHFYTKNLDTLLVAYAQFPAHLRAITPLIVTFDIYPRDRARFMARAKELGVERQVIFTGRVSEGELVALYNEAMFTVYPSRYEGFGYPIAEAMACGSPMITTTAASMPEVAGDATLLVNPEDAEEMTEAMHTLYHDANLRQSLRDKGYAQAQKFNLKALAEATLLAYEQASQLNQSPRPPKPAHPNLYYRSRLAISCYYYAFKRKLYDHVYVPLKKRLLRR